MRKDGYMVFHINGFFIPTKKNSAIIEGLVPVVLKINNKNNSVLCNSNI